MQVPCSPSNVLAPPAPRKLMFTCDMVYRDILVTLCLAVPEFSPSPTSCATAKETLSVASCQSLLSTSFSMNFVFTLDLVSLILSLGAGSAFIRFAQRYSPFCGATYQRCAEAFPQYRLQCPPQCSVTASKFLERVSAGCYSSSAACKPSAIITYIRTAGNTFECQQAPSQPANQRRHA